MRIQATLSALAVSAVLAACGDSVQSPLPTQPSTRPSFAVIPITCDPARIRELITQLYAPNNGGNVKAGLLNKFDQGLDFMPNKQKQALKKFFDVIDRVDSDFRSGNLPVLTNPSTAARRNELFARLLACAGFTVPNLDPEGDIIVGFINDPSKGYTFISTDGDYAVQTPPGMFSEPVLIAGTKQADSFIVQSTYDEFPIKAEIVVTPSGKEVPGKKAIVKVCQYESDFDHEPDRSFMRIAQRHSEQEGEGTISVVKVLQFTTSGPFLICPESPPSNFISDAGFFSRSFAIATRVLHGTRDMIVETFAPQNLYAAAMVDGGVGGFVDQFFSFYAGVEIPDLRVQSITPIPNPPSTLHNIGFQVVLENIGLGASPPSTLYLKVVKNSAPGVVVLDQEVSVDEITGATTDGEGAGPGTLGVTVSFASALTAGAYTVTVTADNPNDVAELNETATVPFLNNTKSQTFTVLAPSSDRIRTNAVGVTPLNR